MEISKAMLVSESQAPLSLQDQGTLYLVEMAFKDRLKSARKDAGLKQHHIAAAVEVTNQAVSGWERGEAMPEPEKIPAIARLLGKTTSWLLDDDRADDVSSEDVAAALVTTSGARTVPIKGYVGAGGQAHYYAVDPGDLGEIEAPDASPQTVAVVIIGKSLGEFFDGWYVFYDDVESPVTDGLIGELCVVGLADDRILIKKIWRGSNGTFDLHSNAENEPAIKGVTIEWAAKVRDLRPR